jgi:hypothetical protein
MKYRGMCVSCFEDGMQGRIREGTDRQALYNEIMGFLRIKREEYAEQIYENREAIVACRNLLRSLDFDLAKSEADFIDGVLEEDRKCHEYRPRGAFC